MMAEPLMKLIERLPSIPHKLKIGREIDRGAWGVVYEGKFDGQQVAVKKMHQMLVEGSGDSETALRSFFEECKRLRDLDHPNVIKFRGVFKDTKLGLHLVMERMNDNLRVFLEKHKDKLSIQEQLRISLEITKGVAFLHQLNPPMVHCDLNDKNVMFSSEGVAKIGDFGQSKLKKDVYLTSTAPGMLLFMPPESLRAENIKYDESLDVFSLGVLWLEIGIQEAPTPNMEGIGTTREVKRREKDLQRMDEEHPLKPFILLCLSDDRKQRPQAAELEMVLTRLSKMEQTLLSAEQKPVVQEAGGSEYSSRVIPLEVALTSARDEIVGSFVRESRQRAQFKADLACRDKSQQQLEDECEQVRKQFTMQAQKLEAEAISKLEVMEKFERERHIFQVFIKGLNEKLKEKEEMLSLAMGPGAELELSLSQSLQDQETSAKTASKSTLKKKTSKKMASRSATARRPESSSMVELREENERLQGLYTALKADCQKIMIEKQQLASSFQEMKSLKETLERENKMLKGHLGTAGEPTIDLQGAEVHPEGTAEEKKCVEMELEHGNTPTQAFVDNDSEKGQGKFEESTHSLEVTSNEPVNHYKVRRATEILGKKDAHTCERCGQSFPKKAVKLLWEHRSLCTASGSASLKRTRSRITRSYTMSSTKLAASDNMLKCKKCARLFLWEQIQLYWSHTCKLSDETCISDHPRQPIQSNATYSGKPLPTTDRECEVTTTTLEVRVKNNAGGASYECKCGKTFTSNQRRQYKMHTWKCPDGAQKGRAQTAKEVRD